MVLGSKDIMVSTKTVFLPQGGLWPERKVDKSALCPECGRKERTGTMIAWEGSRSWVGVGASRDMSLTKDTGAEACRAYEDDY